METTSARIKGPASWVLAVILLAGGGAGQAQLPDFVPLVERYSDAVVSISSEVQPTGGMLGQLPIPEDSPFYEYFKRFFDQLPGEDGEGLPPQISMGSGFIISKDGFILTNAHVVENANEIKVTLSDKREFTAKVVGRDIRTDIAVVRIEATDLPVTKLGNSNGLKVGQWVLAIGSPFGLDYTATQGIISALGRSLPGDAYVPFIQTDAAVNPGNSGGPLFNLSGEVIGVNSMIYSGTGGYMGVSFAIPINLALDVAEQLKAKGRVVRGWLGVMIQDVSPDLAESFGLDRAQGALVAQVMPESPAAKAGVQVGDIIVEFDAKPIENSAALPALVGRIVPGKKVPVTVVRDGKRRSIQIQVEELPEEEGESRTVPDGGETSRLNLVVAELPAEAGDIKGVLVQRVGPGVAAQAGIQAGDIIQRIDNRQVTGVKQFRDLVAELPAGKSVPVLVQRGGRPLFLALKIPAK